MTQREAMIIENMGLVYFYARRYMGKGLVYEDLVQHGMIGLIRAVDRFDPEKGKFSSFAMFHIRERITDSLMNQGTVRTNVPFARKRRVISQAINKFWHANERQPTLQEISDITGISIIDLDTYRVHSYISLDRHNEESNDPKDVITLPIYEEEPAPITNIDLLFSGLTEKEGLVIRLRYGIGLKDEQPQTLAQISERLNVSRERVRQIEASGLDKLRDVPVAIIEEVWPNFKSRR